MQKGRERERGRERLLGHDQRNGRDEKMPTKNPIELAYKQVS